MGSVRRGAGVFNALEINTSFYRIPEEGVVDRWRQRTPRPDFLYTAKAHRVRAGASIEYSYRERAMRSGLRCAREASIWDVRSGLRCAGRFSVPAHQPDVSVRIGG